MATLSAAAEKIYQNSDWVQHLHVKNKLYHSAGKFSRRQIHDTFVIITHYYDYPEY